MPMRQFFFIKWALSEPCFLFLNMYNMSFIYCLLLDDNTSYTQIYPDLCYELSMDMTKTGPLMAQLNMGPYVEGVMNFTTTH